MWELTQGPSSYDTMNHAAFLVGALACAGSLLSQHTCSSSVAALSCGPTLAVDFTPVGAAGNHTITVTCNGLDPNGIGLMIWGQTQVNIPLPNCPMLNDFLWGHIVNLDAAGSHSWSRTWPHWADGYYFIQFGSFTFDTSGSFTVLSTDSMRAECG